MRLLRPIKASLKRNFPKALTAYHELKIRRTYNRAYFKRSAHEVLRLAEDIARRPFPVVQNELDRKARAPGHKSPDYAVIEINNTCNIDCVMCKTSLSTRKKGMMDKETLEMAVRRSTGHGVHNVELHTIGDPLANPKLEDVFKTLRKHHVQTGISTNGLLLSRHLKTLLEYRDVCSVVSFSIDGATKETYEKIRAGGKWEQLLDNLKLAKEKLVPEGVLLKISMVVCKDNMHEVGRYIAMFREYLTHPYANLSFGFVNSLSPDNAYFEAANLFKNHTYINAPCNLVSKPVAHTLVDGRVTVCCRDYDGSLVVGDLKKDTLHDIFQDRPMKDLQAAHQDRALGAFPLCSTCYIVDSRLIEAFGRMISLLLYVHGHEGPSFYQKRVDRFVEMFQGPVEPEQLKALLV